MRGGDSMNKYVEKLVEQRIKQLKEQEKHTKNQIDSLENEKTEVEKILKGIQEELEALEK